MKLPKLVEDWRDSWKWLSMHCMGLATAIIGSWNALPAVWQDQIPARWMCIAAITVIVIGMIGRLVDQGKKE